MFDKILVAVDLDPEGAELLLKKAQSLGSGEVWAIHVVEPQFVQYSIDPTFTGALTRAMEQDAISAARARMKEIFSGSGIPPERQLVTLGRPAERIHEAAEAEDIDTILIGSHARKGLRRLLGSTANAVLHDAPVNVLTMRVPE